MSTIKIVSRWDASRVLYEHETTTERQSSGLAMRDALEEAAKARAYLSGAYLSGAYLSGAYLSGAYLDGAYLAGADGNRVTLVGDRPYLAIGPIGSRCATVSLWLTDAGPLVRAGCFWGSPDRFAEAVQATRGHSTHGREYAAAIALMRVHAEAWTPAEAQKDAA